MKVIAIRTFRNNRNLKIEDANHEHEVHKGAIFEIGGATPFEKLNAADKLLAMELTAANCLGDATDPKVVKAVKDEVDAEKKAEEARVKLHAKSLALAAAAGVPAK